MFIDRCVVEVRSGKGGDGMIAFLHEKYVEKGGPSGGNGGRGASIIFRASKKINTLYNFRHSKTFIGEDGGKGDIKNQYGRSANDVYIDVPCGTVLYEKETNSFIADLLNDGDQIVVAKGGRGGRGNAAFKSAQNRVPRIAENGLPGETKKIVLELKLLADVGLVGLPNAGKSTLLSVVSNANPEIADYPFTTLEPNLGVVNYDKYNSFVMADLPGLIEGAHEGKGLGLTFLRHLERCRVIIHLVSMEEDDPYKSYLTINKEIKEYGCGLEKRPVIIAASKVEDELTEAQYQKFKQKINLPIIKISSLTHEGINELIQKCVELLNSTEKFPLESINNVEASVIYDARLKEKVIFDVAKVKDHVYRIYGEGVERTYNLINISTDEGLMKLLTYLRKINVEKALKEKGAQDGDTVILCDFEFEYIE